MGQKNPYSMVNTVFVVSVTFFISQSALADSFKPYLDSQTVLQVGVGTLDSKLTAARPSNVMYGSVMAETGMTDGNIAIGGVYRKDYQMFVNDDTADYFYATEKSHKLTPGRTYQIQLEKQVFEAKGLSVKKFFQPASNVDVTVGGNVLQAFGLQKGTLKGFAKASKKGNASTYNVKLDYQYSSDEILDRPNVQAPSGIGYAIDARVKWQPTARLSVDMSGRDLLGEIQWSNVPYTTGELTSSVKETDDNGFITYAPHLSGREGYKDSLHQHLKPKVDLQTDYRLNRRGAALTLVGKHVPEADYWGVGGKLPSRYGELQATIWPDNKMLNVGVNHKRFNFSIGTDGLKPSEMHSLWINVGLH